MTEKWLLFALTALFGEAWGHVSLLENALFRSQHRAQLPQSFRTARSAPIGSSTTGCPVGRIDASTALPSPLPDELENALSQVLLLLAENVDASFPATSGLPQAVSLRIDYGGKRLYNASAGDQDPKVKSGAPDENTIFRIGSVSKIFPILMLYQLYDRGVVTSLDDPLSKYAPDFEYPNVFSHARRHYTLRQLASQLSGMQRELPCPMFDCFLTTKEVIERFKAGPGAPFAEYMEPSYSNAAYALLGNVLADFVKVPFAEYVEQNILGPLDMADTGFVITAEVEKRMAKPYVADQLVPNYDIGYNAPAGQMYSTLVDMMKLGRYYLGMTERLFDDGLRRELLMPTFFFRDTSTLQGSPWEAEVLSDGWLMLGKSGNVPGFSAGFALIPNLNLTLAVLWSGGGILSAGFMARTFDLVLPSFVRTLKEQQASPRMPAVPADYTGNYSNGGEVIQVILAQHRSSSFLALLTGPGSPRLGLDFYDERQALSSFDANVPETCLLVMASGQEHLWVVFELGPDGVATSLELPGILYGMKFGKTSELKVTSDHEMVV